MDSIWLLGFISIVFYRVFNAGMNSKSLFYNPPGRYDTEPVFSDDKVFGYTFKTICVALFWPITLPVYGVYKLGKRFQKEA